MKRPIFTRAGKPDRRQIVNAERAAERMRKLHAGYAAAKKAGLV